MLDSGRNNKEYSAWREAVKLRDKNFCKWPNCKKKAKEVHHILIYAHNPGLRTEVKNGICLCRSHHRQIKGKEIFYASMFLSIIERLSDS